MEDQALSSQFKPARLELIDAHKGGLFVLKDREVEARHRVR